MFSRTLTITIAACCITVASLAQTREIKVVAHRGASKFAPENTIAAFLKAAEMGAHYAEMDVRQTSDGHFIIMHDATVNRTTDGKGEVSAMTLKQIKELDAGSWFGSEFKGERIPTLRETLQAIKGKILPDIDFKAGDLEALVKLLDEEGYLTEGNVTFHGGRAEAKAVAELTDKLLIRPSSFDGARGLPKLIEEMDPPIVNIGKASFSEYYLVLIHQKEKLAFVNALRRGDTKKFMRRAIAAGADFLQADNLDILIPLVQEHNRNAGKTEQ
jgi:glycerophosphoryl diester phosphodiesterase